VQAQESAQGRATVGGVNPQATVDRRLQLGGGERGEDRAQAQQRGRTGARGCRQGGGKGPGGCSEGGVPALDFDYRCFFLAAPGESCTARIDRRCEEMVAGGASGFPFCCSEWGLGTNVLISWFVCFWLGLFRLIVIAQSYAV